MRLGIDVGGTFTDLVLVDEAGGRIHWAKTFSTPRDPAQAVMSGIRKVLAAAQAPADALTTIVHGTTIGTNALIERKGARVGLITTDGFRDVLDIGRIERPDGGLYDMSVDLPQPLVRRRLRLEVRERIGADGSVVTPLDEDGVRSAARFLRDEGVEAIAVCYLFSFLNPAHERRTRELCREIYPDAFVSISSEIAPEFREFERSSTTVLNAYLQPIVQRYLDSLSARLREAYDGVDLRLMQASGGMMPLDVARTHAIRIVNSGPAGGAVANSMMGRLAGHLHVIGVDMGGTSFDIGLVEHGRPRVCSDGMLEGYPVKIPMVDVDGIGAGGGSIAWIDPGGALNVGPQSAGAEPGPACYGRGGEHPTVTDANVVLGRINPDYFLGGEIRLDPGRAVRAIEQRVARPLKIPVEDAAWGILRIVTANMVKGISVRVIERGNDVREFAMLAFGGAGPLHAVEIADQLGMKRVIVPTFPSTLSALGAVASDTRHDFVRTLALSERDVTPGILSEALDELEAQGRARLAAEREPPDRLELHGSADMRYQGQSYEIPVPVTERRPLTAADVAATIARFHELHRQIYEFSAVDELVEFINVRMVAVGRTRPLALPRRPRGAPDPDVARKATRPVWFAGAGTVPCPVFDRARLAPGHAFAGPSIVEEPASSTVITPRARAEVDEYGNLIITLE